MPDFLYPYLGAFLVGLSKSGFATGLGMLTTPLLATAVPARLAIGIVLPLLVFADFLTLGAYWKKWDLSRIKWALAGSLLGIAGGMAFVNIISDRILRVSIGATALVLTLLLIVRNIWYPAKAWRPSAWESAAAGAVAGFSSTISHGAGPIIALYLMAQKPEKKLFVATNAVFFTLLNLLKVPPYALSGLITLDTLKQDLKYLPLIPLGVLIGWLANRALPQKAFEYLVYGLLLVTAVHLLLS